jgi:hypothetical protein
VRAKVTGALAELDREKAESEDGGEAAAEPPPFREPAPGAPPAEAPAPKKAARLATPTQPEASMPKQAPRGPSQTPRLQLPSLPKDQGALRGLLAGAAVVLVIVLLLVTGVLGGGDDESGSSAPSAETPSAETAGGGASGEGEGAPATGGKQPTQAALKAVNGSSASGQALFGRAGKTVVLLLAARGLDPSPPGSSYTLSLVRSPSQRLPLIATKVGKAGVISGRFQVAAQVLGLLAGGFDEMEVSLVPNDELKVALAQAKKSRKAPTYGGEAVLAGKVTGPIVEAGGEP